MFIKIPIYEFPKMFVNVLVLWVSIPIYEFPTLFVSVPILSVSYLSKCPFMDFLHCL